MQTRTNEEQIKEIYEILELFNAKNEKMDLEIAECQDVVTRCEGQIEGFADEIVRLDAMYREQMYAVRQLLQKVIGLIKRLNIYRKEKTFQEIQKEIDIEMRAQGLDPDDQTWEKKVDWMLSKHAAWYEQDLKNAQHQNKRT